MTYFCTFCNRIKIQKKPSLVLQHLKSKHVNCKVSNVKELAEVAQKYLQSQKYLDKESKTPISTAFLSSATSSKSSNSSIATINVISEEMSSHKSISADQTFSNYLGLDGSFYSDPLSNVFELTTYQRPFASQLRFTFAMVARF